MGDMPAFSDYVIYVDESGDHDLTSIDPQYPVFVLAFCIFRKDEYVRTVVPMLQDFKFRWFGHDMVVLHESDIRKQKPPFKFLQNLDRRQKFMSELTKIIEACPTVVVACAINKLALAKRYHRPENPYHLALQFCMERTDRFLSEQGQSGRLSYVVFEKRGDKEDAKLELEFRRISDGGNFTNCRIDSLECKFAHKMANSSGLQLADLFARPIGLHLLRPGQPNRAYEFIAQKLRKGSNGQATGYGLKIFP
jgi:predicted transcriptional regulator with HTH domain